MKKNLLIVFGIIAVALIFFINSKKTPEKASSSKYEVGDIARDFSLKNVDGNKVSLSDFDQAKGFILTFTCNTCPFSKMYEQRIIDLDMKYKNQGYPVIAINSNDYPGDSYEDMVSRSKAKGYSFPYLFDETQEIAKAYGATRTPHIYILSKNGGNLSVAYIGAIDNNHKDASAADKKYVEEAVNSLIQGMPVSTTFTKAIGCTIKWKTS